MTAGWSAMSTAPTMAHSGRARSSYATRPAIARSARLAGTFMTARIAGSAPVVTVRKSATSVASEPQM